MLKAKIYSPYGTVTAASFCGKSRAFAELIYKGVFVISICFEAINSEKEPPRTPVIADWFLGDRGTRAVDVEKVYAEVLLSILEALADFIEGKQADSLLEFTMR